MNYFYQWRDPGGTGPIGGTPTTASVKHGGAQLSCLLRLDAINFDEITLFGVE
ncbi:MAG: hypothetical protein KatS3mg112_1102 [Thermogutta sp.]|nr:MAG: hypothetical protein KatS3mg112_1102 [Thermogutta sp.]